MNSYKYIYNDNIELLDNNLGPNGENLTIVILSYNKCDLTIRLLNSVVKYLKKYKRNILIFDNNSDKKEKRKLTSYLKKYQFNCSLYFSKKNLGIAGGRRKAFSLVKTDWIMSLDNDMYFIDNPIKELNDCIDKLGAKFINVPAYKNNKKEVFINGGKFKIINNDPICITASTYNEKICYNMYLSSFVFGGSSLINKYAYDLIGGYDKKFFVGYEDVDLSIRCYKAGIKIANINKFSLIHEHLILKDEASVMYEKTRYNYERIMKSVNYFMKKYKNQYNVLSKGEKEFLDEMRNKL